MVKQHISLYLSLSLSLSLSPKYWYLSEHTTSSILLTCVQNLILWHHESPDTVLPLKVTVGVFPLGVFIQGLHVGVGGGTVQIVVQLLHILPMVPLEKQNFWYIFRSYDTGS